MRGSFRCGKILSGELGAHGALDERRGTDLFVQVAPAAATGRGMSGSGCSGSPDPGRHALARTERRRRATSAPGARWPYWTVLRTRRARTASMRARASTTRVGIAHGVVPKRRIVEPGGKGPVDVGSGRSRMCTVRAAELRAHDQRSKSSTRGHLRALTSAPAARSIL